MNKHGQDEPRKKIPTMKGLEKVADEHPDADVDTKYQDNKGKTENSSTAAQTGTQNHPLKNK